MTEAQLNENIIKNKIKGICQDCIYLEKIVPVINQMLNEEYVKGLGQGKFDKENEKQQLISFLEDKIKNYEEDIENSKPYLEHKELFQQVQNDIHTSKCIITNLKEVLDFVNKGGKDE